MSASGAASPRYSVELAKEQLVFSAAHFITFRGDICERLHGHNYRVKAEVAGPLDENYYVMDFIALRDHLQVLVNELDHRMLLPTQHHLIMLVPTTSKSLPPLLSDAGFFHVTIVSCCRSHKLRQNY